MGTDVFSLINGKYLKVDYIKGDEEVNQETELAILQNYSPSDELKLLRLNQTSPNSPDFITYNSYVESCRAIGKSKKVANAAALALLKEVDLPQQFGEPVKIMVR